MTQVDCRSSSEQMLKLRAPVGCLQHFTSASGEISSFNFNFGHWSIERGQNYAVCFRQDLDVCGIEFKSVYFNMPGNGEEGGCEEGSFVDVFDARHAQKEEKIRKSRFCGSKFGNLVGLRSNGSPHMDNIHVAFRSPAANPSYLG